MQSIDLLATYEYGVYKIPNGFAIADPLDGDDGYYITGTNLEALCNEAIEHLLADVEESRGH